MTIKALLDELQGRLPELEWKLGQLAGPISARTLPKGLFHVKPDSAATSYIAEVRHDIDLLARQKNEYSAFYLAERIRQKINVLVLLCQMKGKSAKADEHPAFGLQMISTRQQWLQSLEKDIAALRQQRDVMLKALEQMTRRGNTQALLDLQAQLGALEKKMTIAEEAYTQAQGA